MKFLFVAEKPSLMRDVKQCYERHKKEIQTKVGIIDFVALSGHVCTNFEPNDYDYWKDFKWDEVDYPMIPDHWFVKPISDDRKIETIKKIKSILSSYGGIIVGTDSDVEGYGIYYMLATFLKIKNKKTLRFIEHSLTDKEILQSLLSMTDYNTDQKHINCVDSFKLRSRLDWLYGMNITRLVSLKQGDVLTVGRVKAPTIKLVYDNSLAIEQFKEKTYYILQANYGNFKSTYIDDKKQPIRFDKKEDIPEVVQEGTVVKKEQKQKKTLAPQLYDLASIQTDAGQMYGLKPSETLQIIQSLYENHKIISYPRTQCRFVSSEKAKEFPDMLEKIKVFPELQKEAEKISSKGISFAQNNKRVVNDKEVEKESHDALLPTSNTPTLTALSKEEYNVCLLIFKRLLAQFMPPLDELKTELLIKHNDKDFLAKGNVTINPGWRILYKQKKDTELPDIEKGEVVFANKFDINEQKTKPPRRLTQHSLIHAMENIAKYVKDEKLRKSLSESKGIGTSATRANIIQEIIQRGYIQDRKGGLYITPLGRQYINAISDIKISQPIFAAIMDYKVKRVQRGELSFEEGYDEVIKDLTHMCKEVQAEYKKQSETSEQCPVCGNTLKINRYYYTCSNETCDYKIPKIKAGNLIDEKTLHLLLNGESTNLLTFQGKDKKNFDAKLYIDFNDGYKLKYKYPPFIDCPVCGNQNITINKGGAFCSCGLKIFRNIAGHQLSNPELETLLKHKILYDISDLKNKKGETFEANLKLEGKEIVFDFSDDF